MSGVRSSSNSASGSTRGSTTTNNNTNFKEDFSCTCSGGSSEKGSGGGVRNVTKVKNVSKRDMATSPNLGPKSPKIIIPHQQPVNYSSPSVIDALPTPSSPPPPPPPPPPKSPTSIKSRTTRSAATSPRVDLKQQRPALSPIRIDHQNQHQMNNATDDGSLSPRPRPPPSPLGDPKSHTRLLRSARSLSPRPPIRHQHAITVCDENEVVSVKLSPNDLASAAVDYDPRKSSSSKRCQSEHASPNVFEERNFLYENGGGNEENERLISTNRSMGCLVYVPSDPWLRMSDEDLAVIHSKNNKNKKKKEQRKPTNGTASAGPKSTSQFVFPMVAKARSKPNILDYDDPWVWQGSGEEGAGGRGKGAGGAVVANRKLGLNRQAKSLQSREREHASQSQSAATSTGDVRVRASGGGGVAAPGLRSIETLGMVSSAQNVSSSLQVTMNLQPRHSFSSSPSQRDDELQLNIRRLSEQQMRFSNSGRSPMCSIRGGNFSEGGGGGGGVADLGGTWDRTGGVRKLGKGARQQQPPPPPKQGKTGGGGDQEETVVDSIADDALLETTC